jgi:hypothetical protein
MHKILSLIWGLRIRGPITGSRISGSWIIGWGISDSVDEPGWIIRGWLAIWKSRNLVCSNLVCLDYKRSNLIGVTTMAEVDQLYAIRCVSLPPSGSCDQQAAWLFKMVVLNSHTSHACKFFTTVPQLSGNKWSHKTSIELRCFLFLVAGTGYARNKTKVLKSCQILEWKRICQEELITCFLFF